MSNKVVVDDDESVLKILKAEFTVLGYETETFLDGKEAHDYIFNKKNQQKIVLLILDRMLPDMDGLDILRELINKKELKIPTLILSALIQENEVLEGLQEGAVDYITKPFSVLMLMQKAQNLLRVQEE
jgi:DNA-binding response OmpR family regulator